MASLYEQLGGEAAITAAVDIFYRKMLSDDRVAPFFDSVDMDGQRAKQAAFITMATGGPNNYTGKDLREGHKHLVEKGLNDSHVDIVVEHLAATLKELGVGDEQIQQVSELVNSGRDDVLGR